jgi:hypothetical protein
MALAHALVPSAHAFHAALGVLVLLGFLLAARRRLLRVLRERPRGKGKRRPCSRNSCFTNGSHLLLLYG